MTKEMNDQDSGDNTRTMTNDPDDTEYGEAAKPEGNLYSLDDHAARRRIPAWQQAALMRARGWAEGKKLTDDEYDRALNELKFRRMGSGRTV